LKSCLLLFILVFFGLNSRASDTSCVQLLTEKQTRRSQLFPFQNYPASTLEAKIMDGLRKAKENLESIVQNKESPEEIRN
jgi:hypothetical protein